MISRLFLLTCAIQSVWGFVPLHHHAQLQTIKNVKCNVNSPYYDTATCHAMSAVPATDSKDDELTLQNNEPQNKKEPNMMDENIYNFNKILIDTVYNVICFVYPVTGSKRDFARFYVLETVARVPYFAYLSVLHLR